MFYCNLIIVPCLIAAMEVIVGIDNGLNEHQNLMMKERSHLVTNERRRVSGVKG